MTSTSRQTVCGVGTIDSHAVQITFTTLLGVFHQQHDLSITPFTYVHAHETMCIKILVASEWEWSVFDSP